MKNIKLKDLKYIIPGNESAHPGRQVVFAVLLPGILMMLVCVGVLVVSAFKEVVDKIDPRTAAASIIFVCLVIHFTLKLFKR